MFLSRIQQRTLVRLIFRRRPALYTRVYLINGGEGKGGIYFTAYIINTIALGMNLPNHSADVDEVFLLLFQFKLALSFSHCQRAA